MRRSNLARTLGMVCATILLAVSTANAAFNFEESQEEAKQKRMNATAALENSQGYSVTQLGSGSPVRKSSFGKGMALSRALKLITPENWSTTAGPYGEEEVSWETGEDQTWIEALEQLGSNYNLRFVVDWKNRCVMVPSEGEVFADGGDVSKKKNATQEKDSFTVVRVSDLAEMERPEKKWELKPGSLKKQLTKWAERAGYSVVWNSKHDYRISADATFEGDFTQAVTDTVEAFYRNGARITADIYRKNKVLYIGSAKDKE